MLIIAALRSRGIAARFVSGYLHLNRKSTKKTSIQLRVATPTLGSRLTFQVLAGLTSIRYGCCGETRTSSASRLLSTRGTQFLYEGHGMEARRITLPWRLR